MPRPKIQLRPKIIKPILTLVMPHPIITSHKVSVDVYLSEPEAVKDKLCGG